MSPSPAPDDRPGLSPQQAKPLATSGASVALGAGAGSGKTTVLTERFIRDLDGPGARALGSIVALTFTEKAARELRKRIRRECREKLARREDPARWRAILRGLEAAPIGTFHEFCGQWLRRHAVAAEIDPDFTILDATIAGTVREEALARCLRRWLAALDPDLIELAVEFGLGQVREALADLLDDRASGRLEDWKDRTPEQVVAIWRDAWEREGRRRLFARVVQAARPCLKVLSEHQGTHPRMRERQAFLLEHLPGLGQANPDEDLLQQIGEHAKVQGGGTKAHWPSEEVFEEVKATFTGLRDAIKEFRKRAQWDEAATLEAAEQGLRLARLALDARAAYDKAKRERGGLDFDDLLTRTRALLRDAPETTRAVGEAIERLLVDEFQDTDPVQGEILDRLAGEEGTAGRLFLVGDFKQSIYRFRGAEPQIFEQFRARFPEGGRHALTENFRSVPEVLDFVNALFAETFPGPENALVARRGSIAAAGQPAIEFLWASETEETEGPKGTVRDRRRLEARWLARRLRQRIDAGWTILDPRTKALRPADAGDVAFLFRAMTDVAPYESALAEEGFDYHTVGGSAFYVQQEVHDLINVLSAIEDPLDVVALAGSLRSPFFCLSDDGLYWLGTARPDLVEGLSDADQIAELSDLDRAKAVRARDLLSRWRASKDRLPIAALVDRVLDESGYEAALLGEPFGGRKRANARKLVRLARRFDQEGGFTLAAFVARLRADLRRPPREEQAATTDEEGTSIRLMSIHQAKGLEFPIVVLPDLNRRPPGRLGAVAFHPELGPLVRPSKDPSSESAPAGDDVDPSRQSLGWLTYQAIERREEEDESFRLFYVATTRARDALILSAGVGPAEKAASPAMTLLDRRFDRLSGRCRHEGWNTPAIHVSLSCPPASTRTGRPSRDPPPLLAVADAIESAPPEDTPPPPAVGPAPRFMDLDPTATLAAPSARLDRTVRAILADLGVWRTPDWTGVAERAARRHDPLITPRRLDDAIERVRPVVEGPIGREVAEAVAIEHGVDWTLAWPPEAPDATVFHGRADLVYRDRGGEVHVVVLADAVVPESRERLRLLFSSRAVDPSGQVRRGWRVSLGPGGSIERADRLDEEAIRPLVG